jgi:hypothetical protein
MPTTELTSTAALRPMKAYGHPDQFSTRVGRMRNGRSPINNKGRIGRK